MKNRDMYGFYSVMFLVLTIQYVRPFIPFLPQTFAGFTWTGWGWVVMLLATIYYFVKNPRYSFPIWFWIPWLIYLFGYLLFDGSLAGLQLSLQYALPIFVGVVASGFTYGEEEYHWLFKWLVTIATVIAVFFIVGHFLDFYRPGWAPTVIFLSVPATVVLGVYFLTKKIKFLLLFCVFFLVPFLLVTRMALAAFAGVLLLHFANRRMLSRVFAGVLTAVFLLLAFNSKGFQEKTFFEGEGALSDISINYYEADSGIMNTSGRAIFYRYFEQGLREAPLFGNGPRSDFRIMRSFTELNETHNDYLSIRYNYGYVGLVLILAGFLGSFLAVYDRYRLFKRLGAPYGFLAAAIALTLFVPFLLFMYSDNILKYTIFFPNMFFAVMGIVFAKKENVF